MDPFTVSFIDFFNALLCLSFVVWCVVCNHGEEAKDDSDSYGDDREDIWLEKN